MNSYNLLEFKNRKGTNSLKWDELESQFGRSDLLAAWVADMDIASPACVNKALKEYVDFNTYGYQGSQDRFKDAFIHWMKEYHNYEISEHWIRYAPGVVPAIYWIIQMMTEIEDSVAIMSPVYYPFANAIRDTSRTLVDVPLLKNEEGYYRMDLEKFEETVQKKDVKLFILCSPHNPVGRVWTEEELRSVLDICRQNGVYVIADEIHHDIIMPGQQHISAATLGDYDSILFTLTSASKTFNLASCQNAMAIIPNDALRSKYDSFVRHIHLQNGSSFGYIAYEAAFREGREWLEELRQLVYDNFQILSKGIKHKLPEAVVSPLQGTYLAWVDLSAYLEEQDTDRVMKDVCGLALDLGEWFGRNRYENFVRINLATSPENVQQIVARLDKLKSL
jgi:cysteine-S-conjugate beta-lyase